MQEAQRLLVGAGRKATVSLRERLWRREQKAQAVIAELAEQVELVPGLFSPWLQDTCTV